MATPRKESRATTKNATRPKGPLGGGNDDEQTRARGDQLMEDARERSTGESALKKLRKKQNQVQKEAAERCLEMGPCDGGWFKPSVRLYTRRRSVKCGCWNI